jgi:hypothetical protein
MYMTYLLTKFDMPPLMVHYHHETKSKDKFLTAVL